MADEKVSDDEIRELWTQHFLKRLDDVKTLFEVFRLVVEQRTATGGHRRGRTPRTHPTSLSLLLEKSGGDNDCAWRMNIEKTASEFEG